MKLRLVITIATLSALLGGAAQQGNGQLEVQLQRAVQKEMAAGDLKAAIEEYKKIAARAGSNRALGAKALLHLAEAYEKQGGAEARKTYEQIVKQYADQHDMVTQAQQRLAAMGSGGPARVSIRQFYDPKANPDYTLWNISDDGRYAGATNYATGNAAIVDLATGKGWNVTDYGNWNNEKGYIDLSAISRDGKQIAFWHYKYHATEGQLRMVGADGKNERTLYRAKGIDGSDEWGMPKDWSPDGRQIVMQIERQINGSQTHGVTEFMLVPAAGGPPRVVKTAEYIRRDRPQILFSPDGRYVAYDYPPRKEAANRDIFIVPVDGGPEIAIAAHPARDVLAGWAPDGSILFLSERTGSVSLYRVPVKDGKQAGEPALLRGRMGGISTRGVSRSGGLYYSSIVNQANAYTAALDFDTGRLLSSPVRMSQHITDSTSMPSWSADGHKVAYVKLNSDGGAPALLIRADGESTERELLPAMRVAQAGVRWSSDARYLMGVGTKDNEGGLHRIDTGTGETALVRQGLEIMEWSPDGKWVLLRGGAERRSVIRRNTVTGEEQIVHTGRPRSMRLSPDGRRLLFIEPPEKPSDKSFLGTVSTDGGEARRLFVDDSGQNSLAQFNSRTAWSPDGRYALFVRQTSNQPGDKTRCELWVVPADGGQARKTELASEGPMDYLNVHPDGKRVAYSVALRRDEYWVMKDFLP